MHPKGAKKNKLAHAMFSNEGPNLNNPDVTKRPKVTPKDITVIIRTIVANQV